MWQFMIKKVIGQPLQCAGLVSTNINKVEDVPNKYIKNKIKGAYLTSPDNTTINVKKEGNAAYVLDRVNYDQYLSQRAENEGAQINLNSKVTDINTKIPSITVNNETITSNLLVVANGPTSPLIKKINPDIENNYFTAIQYTVKTDDINTDYVNLDVNADILPGFIWSIPVSETRLRIGLFTPGSFDKANKLLQSKIKQQNFTIIKKHYGKIPYYNSNKNIYKDNTILLGDAASQVKPTTGGGLIVGFNCTDMAVECTNKMLEYDNNKYLKEYLKQYRKTYKNEFKTQQTVQNILKSLTEDDMNYMFKELKECHVDTIISEYGDMDTQTPLIKELIKTGVLFKLLPKIGTRSLKNIWK